MKTFIGTKIVLATPMTLGAYNEHQGWKIPEGQDPQTDGYLVEYTDGGKPNHPDHEGYISWSPKDVFENSYHTLQDKVDYEHINSMIDSLTFQFARIGDTTTTVCEAFLPNGFSVGSGKSACVDPSNFDYELGCEYAKENALQDAKQTLWQLEGYLLKVTGKTSDKHPQIKSE